MEVAEFRVTGSLPGLAQQLFYELSELGFVRIEGRTLDEEGWIEKVILMDFRGRCLTLILEEKRFFWAAELKVELAFFESERCRSTRVWKVFAKRELIQVER